MRERIKFILYYAVMGVFLSIFFTFVYVQYLSCTHIVAGRHFDSSIDIIIYSFLKSVPMTFIFSQLILIIYRVRHDENPVSSFVIFCILSVITWVVLFPIAENYRNRLTRKLNTESFDISYNDNIPLSGGYFRKTEHNIFYFTKDSEKDFAHVIELFNDGHAPLLTGEIPPTPEQLRYPRERMLRVGPGSFYTLEVWPFRDTHMKEILDSSIYTLMDYAEILLFSAVRCWNTSLLGWAAFLSLAFALGTVYAYSKLSSWRLINYLSVITTYGAIIALNCFYFTPLLKNLRDYCIKVVFGVNGFGNAKHFLYFWNNGVDLSICFINILVGLVILLLAFIAKCIRQSRGD